MTFTGCQMEKKVKFMDLYEEMLIKEVGKIALNYLNGHDWSEEFAAKEIGEWLIDGLNSKKLDYEDMIRIKSYETLNRIKAIIADELRSDFECVEDIVCIFEDIGSKGGGRHDF